MANAAGRFSREIHVYIETGLSKELNHRGGGSSDLWPNCLGVDGRFTGVLGKRFPSGGRGRNRQRGVYAWHRYVSRRAR
jgi:hypothetical protein